MAGANQLPGNPISDPEDSPFGSFEVPELTFEEKVDRRTQRALRQAQAFELLGSDFDVELPEYTPPAVEPSEDYEPPETFEDARARIQQSRDQLEEYRRRIEAYAEETRGVLPMDEQSTAEVIERGGVIARGRRDILHTLEQLEEAEKQLAEAEQGGHEDPGFWQKALGVAGDALGAAMPVLQFLGGPQEIVAGTVSQIPELFGKMPHTDPDGNLLPAGEEGWSELSWWDRVSGAQALFDPEHPLRQRGRQYNIAAAAGMSQVEASIMDTPILGEVYSYTSPMGVGPKLASAATGYDEQDVRDFRNRLSVEIVTDPLLVLGAGPVTKMGRLRELSRVGAGVLDNAALRKTLDELPELGRALGGAEEAFDVARRGDIVTQLRIRGLGPDEAADLAKQFDAERVRNLSNLRKLASNDPTEFARYGREALEQMEPATKIERKAHARQMKYLDEIHKFGRPTDKNFVDPIIGRSWYEQAMLGQRLAAMQPIIRRFGDKPWLQNTIRYGSRPWMSITGTSIKHDISDKPELLELYYMQQLRRMDMGSEFHRYEQDVSKRAANILNDMTPEEARAVQEAAIPLVERVKKGKRMVEAGQAFPDDDGLANAAYQYAKWYEYDAATARAIENRFNFRVAELSGDLGYFGREFSDELKQLILNNKHAREWLWGTKARRGADNISTAWLDHEKGRKFREEDFFESESALREQFQRMGLAVTDDMPMWKREGFDILSKRLSKSADIAERRGLAYGWVEAAGEASDDVLDVARGVLDEMAAQRVARAVAGVGEAGGKYRAATEARVGFEEGRTAVRGAGRQAAREADVAPGAADAVADVGAAPADLRVSLRTEQDLRKMFPDAPEIADDAEAAMRGMADAVSRRVTEPMQALREAREATRRSNEAVRKAKQLAKEASPEKTRAAQAQVRRAEAVAAKARKAAEKLEAALDAEKAASGGKAAAQARRKSAYRDYFKAQEQFNKATGDARDAANKAMQNATRRLTDAQDALKKAREGGDPEKIRKAEEAVQQAEKRATEAEVEVQAARRVAQQAEEALKRAREDAGAAARTARELRQEAVEVRKKVKPGTTLSRDAQRRAEKATEKFYDAYQNATTTAEYRRAVREYADELKKIAPPAMVKEFTKRADDALKQLERLEKAQGAVAKPVAAAVRKQQTTARKGMEAAEARLLGADVSTMSPDQKAKWVEATLTAEGIRPGPHNVTALEVMRTSNIPMPDDLDELARLHVTEFTARQAEEFRKLHDKLYWSSLESGGVPGLLDNIAKVLIDYPKRVLQGTVLARWASVSKDLLGNAVNLAMNPQVIPHFARAFRDSWKAWRAGEYADDVAELQHLGVLRTSRQESLEGGTEIAKLIPGATGRTLERVGEMGPIGGSIKTLDKAVNRAAKKAGIKLKEGKHLAEGAAWYRDLKLQARQIFEEAGRIATYREALSRGFSKQEAVEEVYKWWGKFDELTKLERGVLNRMLFFWTWMMRSIPVALRHLVEHPVRSRLVLTMLAGDVTDDERMPPWLRRMGGWVLGDDGDGRVRAMSTMGSSWFSPLFSALQGEAANAMMSGQPWDAAQGALKDVARSAPPHVGAAVEFAYEYDLFTQKPWWQDRNARVGSNAKAPNALWWFHDTAIGETLGLKSTGKSGEPQYLTMDPRWSWFFGMTGIKPGLGDVSAFFRPSETSEIIPEIDVLKGSARMVGIPVYDVPIETGRRQLHEFQNALLKEGERLPGDVFSTYGGRLSPSDRTTKGRQIRGFMEMAKTRGKDEMGMTAAQADRYALTQLAQRYPAEFRLLDLQWRLDTWGEHIQRTEEGRSELAESLGQRIELLNRRAQFDRVAKEELKQLLDLYADLGLKPKKQEPATPRLGMAAAKKKRERRRAALGFR